MSIKLTRRIAAELLGRGESKVRIKPDRTEDAKKSITREDVRALISSGGVYAIKAKHNQSLYSKELREKRNKGRRRGPGRRKGTAKARSSIDYVKKVRGQRRVLAAAQEGQDDRQRGVQEVLQAGQGRELPDEGQLLSHLTTDGVKIEPERLEQLRHM
jgi:large subunit ribosomal protein L19e